MNDETIYSSLADAVNSAVSRRKFMQLSGVGAGSILGGSMLAKLQAVAAPAIKADEGVLVLIYLGGGNDPLNTFAPYSNNAYRTLRPNLSLSPDNTNGLRKCLPVDEMYGFHSSLINVKALYDQGKVSMLPGVGFEGQDLSHFTSGASYMGGWTGDGKAATGWAGRFLDTLDGAAEESTRGITINGTMPLTIQGAISKPISLPTDIKAAYNARQNEETAAHCFNDLSRFSGYASGSMSDAIAKNTTDTLTLPARYGSSYPDLTLLSNPSTIERNLAISAGVINANLGARVIHVTLGGFDTHTNQLESQAISLSMLDKAIGTFFKTLSPTFADRVTLMTYSEFGRRVQENGDGTDHGRAALMMMMGNKVQGGIATPFPSLTSLDSSGNLANTVDFRKVYAEVSTTWLKTDETRIVGSSYDSIGIFKSGPGSSTGTTQPSTTQPSTTKPSTSTTTTRPVDTTTTTKPATTSTTTTTKPPTTTTTTKPPTTTTTTKPPTTTTTTKPATTTTTTTKPPTTTTTRPATTTTRPATTTTTRPATTTTRPATTTTVKPTTTTRPATSTTKPMSSDEYWLRIIKALIRRGRRRRR